MDVCVICGQSGEILKKAKEHTKQINDIQTSVDLTMFISASKDNTAKVRPLSTQRHWLYLLPVLSRCVGGWFYLHTASHQSVADGRVSSVSPQLFDCTSLDHIKTFKTERPVNSAAISPIMDHVRANFHSTTCTMSQLCGKICAVVIQSCYKNHHHLISDTCV